MEEEGAFDITVQLNTVKDRRGYHRRNAPGEIQRPDIVDDFCKDLLVKARIDRIVHGQESPNGKPATLIVFAFRFHGLDYRRRLRQATISISFEDKQKRGADSDPVVIGLWPDGDYTLGDEIPVDEETTRKAELGGNLGVTNGGIQATAKWEKKKSQRKNMRASLTGSMDLQGREFGSDNAIRVTVQENPATTSGLVTDLRAAVLLRRDNDKDLFVGSVDVSAKGHFSYNIIRGLRDISGGTPPKDPVVFKPGKQYMRPNVRGKLAEKIDESNLGSVKLEDLTGALSTTLIVTTATQ